MNKSAIGDSVGGRAGKVDEGSYLEEEDHQKSQMESVQVCVRIRKLNAREEESLQPICVLKDSSAKGRLTIGHTGDNQVVGSDLKDFIFDTVIGPDENQDDVFEKVGKQIVTACLSGYNACVFAYGQTGAGKTYTMLGAGDQEQGLIQKMLHLVFARLKSKNQEYVIQCSFFEIYMEEIIDLMQPNKAKNIRVIEDFNGVRVDNLAQVQVTNHFQAVELIKKGQKSRHVASTRMNAESSRSHSIFSMTINVKDKDPSTGVLKERMAKLHFVDLAGSERQKQTQASGQRLKEAAQINQSLTTLGIVIHSLSEGHKKICYRNSKLTHLLKDSLGGNSKTLMIAAVSPSADSYGETLSTLKFAERVKFVKNVAQVNEKASESLDNLKKEISALKAQLQNANKHQKVQQEMIDNFHHRSLEIQPILSSLQNKQEIEEIELNKRELLLDLHLEERIREQQIQQDILKESVQDFQVWMRQFLETSGFVDLISELKMRVGLNVENISSVESARDSQMHQWSSLFSVSTDKLKDYISAMSEFTVLTNQIQKQAENNRKMNSNNKSNLEIINAGESIHNSKINRSLQMDSGILQQSSVAQNSRINNQNTLSNIDENEQDNSTYQSCITIQEKMDDLSQIMSSKEHQNQSFHDKSQGYSILASNQGDCPNCASWRNELSKWRRHVNLIENEYREMQEENMTASERTGEQIRTLQNEVDSLQMQNLTLQEQLEAEEQKVMVLREEQERKEEKKDNLSTTLQYKEKLVLELQLELKEERKQKADMYKYFRIDAEQIGAVPFENMWRYVESLRSDCQNEKDNFQELSLRSQRLLVQQQEMLAGNNGKRLVSLDRSKLRDVGYLRKFIAQRDEENGNELWNDRVVLMVLVELIEEINARDEECIQMSRKNQEIQAVTSEEIAYLRQVQADNVQTIQELNEQLQDSQIFYNLKTKNFQNKLQTIRKQNIQNYHLSHNQISNNQNNHNNLVVLNQSFEFCSNSCKDSQQEKSRNQCNGRSNSQDNNNISNQSYSNQSNNKRNLTYCESTPSKQRGKQDKNNSFQSDILHSERLKIADSLKMNLNPVFQAAASPFLSEKQQQMLEGFNSANTPFNDSALSNIIMRSESDTLSDRNTFKDIHTPGQDNKSKQQSIVFGSHQKVSQFQNFKPIKHSQPSPSSDAAILADIVVNNNNQNARNRLKDSKNANQEMQKKMNISEVLAASTDEDKVESSLEQYYSAKSMFNKGNNNNNNNRNDSYASQFGEVNRFSIEESQIIKQQSQPNTLKRFKSEQKSNGFWQNSQQKENAHNRLTVSEKKLDKQQLHQIQATKSNAFNIEYSLNVIEEIERAKEIKKIQKHSKSKQYSQDIEQQQPHYQEEKQNMTTSQLEKKNQLLHAMELIKEDYDDEDDDSFNEFESEKEDLMNTQYSPETKKALNLPVKKKQCSEAAKQLPVQEKQ